MATKNGIWFSLTDLDRLWMSAVDCRSVHICIEWNCRIDEIVKSEHHLRSHVWRGAQWTTVDNLFLLASCWHRATWQRHLACNGIDEKSQFGKVQIEIALRIRFVSFGAWWRCRGIKMTLGLSLSTPLHWFVAAVSRRIDHWKFINLHGKHILRSIIALSNCKQRYMCVPIRLSLTAIKYHFIMQATEYTENPGASGRAQPSNARKL